MRIKFLLIFSVLLSIVYTREKIPWGFMTETSYPVVGLFDPEDSNFWLVEKKVKAIVEGPYVQIQSFFTFKNNLDDLVASKFEFPQAENDVFHKVEIKHQDSNIILFEEANSPKKEFAKVNSYTGERYSYIEIEAGSLSANTTVEVVFTVIRPLKVQLNQFYELSIRPYQDSRFGTIYSGFFKADYDIQIELKSERPFAILANPTHVLRPKLLNHTDSLSGIVTHKALYNLTMYGVNSFSREFKIYFASSDFNAPQTIMATAPFNPQYHSFMFSLIPDMKYFPFTWDRTSRKDARSILKNLSNLRNFFKLKNLTIQSDLNYFRDEYLFLIDRNEGAHLEDLKRTLNKFLGTLSRSPAIFSILSFGSALELSESRTQEKFVKLPEDTNRIMKWVETLEADMGEKDLFGALKYVFEEYEWSRLPKNVIILTAAEDIRNLEEIIKLVQANSHSQKICAMKVYRGEDNMEKIGKAGGCEIEWSRDFEDRVLNVLDSTLKSPDFKLAYEITCINDQNQTVHQEEGSSDGISKDEAFIKWVTLQGIPNLNSCKAKIFYYSEQRCSSYEQEIVIFRSQAAQSTEVWHKVAERHGQLKNEEPKRKLMIHTEKDSAVVFNQIESQEGTKEEWLHNDKPGPQCSLYDAYLEQFNKLQCYNPKGLLLSGVALDKSIFKELTDDEDDEMKLPLRQKERREMSISRDEDGEDEGFSAFEIICTVSVLTLLFVAGLFVIS